MENYILIEYQRYMLDIFFGKQKSGIIDKWIPIIKNKINVYNDNILDKLSMFLEVYMKIDGEIPSSISYQSMKPIKQYPDGWIKVEDISKILSGWVDETSFDLNYEIIKEYYNIFRNEKTYLVKTPDGEIMLNKIESEKMVNKILNNEYDEFIKYVLFPEKRKQYIRKKKLKRILK